ncbi:hypothetical protein NE237_027964 [Protea cynaroides]|uniref:Uncharacterized protein n=1 Tax=Protea cynaroides TaxID=273540 RepID=A0A9Q0GSC3_9MAGN|nr:hypothetical protein NE237_027964 [Protea cynaroides]
MVPKKAALKGFSSSIYVRKMMANKEKGKRKADQTVDEREEEADPFIRKWDLTINDSVIDSRRVDQMLLTGACLPVDVNQVTSMDEEFLECNFFLNFCTEASKIVEEQEQSLINLLAEIEKLKKGLAEERKQAKTSKVYYKIKDESLQKAWVYEDELWKENE